MTIYPTRDYAAAELRARRVSRLDGVTAARDLEAFAALVDLVDVIDPLDNVVLRTEKVTRTVLEPIPAGTRITTADGYVRPAPLDDVDG